METYFLNGEDTLKFYGQIAETFELFVPVKIKSLPVKCEYGFSLPCDDYLFVKFNEAKKEEIVFNEYRCIEPLRALFTHFKEAVGDYFTHEGAKTNKHKPIAVSGVKNCDIFSLKIQDFVFLGGDKADPIYKQRKENCLIISGDCPGFKEACFCRAFDINPHVTEGFDFNLSLLNDGYLVDVATDKAKEVAKKLKSIFTPAGAGQISGRQAKRNAVIERMEGHLAQHKIPKKEVLKEIVTSGYNSAVWDEQMRTCVECGGCVFMCDTCHCFLLSDESKKENSQRLRIWDGCLFKNFSRVAGGANPLKKRYMRLRNRYLKKFDFFIENIGFQACCACGRCIDVCPGRIDIRYILRRLYEEKFLTVH